jgi:hypothetical protein
MPGLKAILWILLRVASLLFLCESFPLVLDFFWFSLPKLTSNFRDLWIRETSVLRYDSLLVVLAVENER